MTALAPLFALHILAGGGFAAPAAAPALQAVLEKHALDAERLKTLGFALVDGDCYRLGPGGEPLEPALSAEELEAALGVRGPASRVAQSVPDGLPEVPEKELPNILPAFYEGSRLRSEGTMVPDRPPSLKIPSLPQPPEAGESRFPLEEPEFDASWDKIAKDLWSRQRRLWRNGSPSI